MKQMHFISFPHQVLNRPLQHTLRRLQILHTKKTKKKSKQSSRTLMHSSSYLLWAGKYTDRDKRETCLPTSSLSLSLSPLVFFLSLEATNEESLQEDNRTTGIHQASSAIVSIWTYLSIVDRDENVAWHQSSGVSPHVALQCLLDQGRSMT